jgi:hypothetical protein
MTETQISQAEVFYSIVFPPDFKELLRTFLPVSDSFYDWSNYSADNVKKIRDSLKWPIEGALFDVRENELWLKTWGKKPSDINERLLIAEKNMINVPKLIPIHSHRYIPSVPNEAGNPIFSVYQMDVIFYGSNIWEYFYVEFKEKQHKEIDFKHIRYVPFWYDIVCDIENLVESYSGMLLPENDCKNLI